MFGWCLAHALVVSGSCLVSRSFFGGVPAMFGVSTRLVLSRIAATAVDDAYRKH